jgi:hypothetical protein
MVDWLPHGWLAQVGWIACVCVIGRFMVGLSVDGLIRRVHVDGGAGGRIIGVLPQYILPHEFFPLPLAVAVAGDYDNDGDGDDTSDNYPRDESC